MFEPLYTAEEMRAAEAGHDVKQLMRRAGGALAEFILGQVAARRLRQANRDVRVVESKPEDEEKDLGKPGVIVDALFGTGFTGEPRPGAARLIEQINAAGVDVVAVDVPSGVDASTGEVAGAVVDAAWTVTFHREKVGLYVAPGALHCGELEVVDIGLQDRETVYARPTVEILDLVPLRSPRDTKYTAGSVLVVGGSPGLTGAASLAARAAFRADAGYVAVAAPRASLPVLEQPSSVRSKRSGTRWGAHVRSRSGPGSAGPTARRRSSAGCSKRPICRQSSMRTRCSSWIRSRAARRPFSRRTPASSGGCSTSRRRGSMHTAWRLHTGRSSVSSVSSC